MLRSQAPPMTRMSRLGALKQLPRMTLPGSVSSFIRPGLTGPFRVVALSKRTAAMCASIKQPLRAVLPISVRSVTSSASASSLKVAVQSGCVAAAADLAVQMLTNQTENTTDVDIKRTGSFFAFGCGYSGVIQRAIYRRFDRIFGLQSTLQVIGAKVAADVFVHAPFVYVPSFYLSTGMLQGYSFPASCDRLRVQYVDTVKAYLTIWLVPMTVCFRYVPEPSRVLFVAGCAFVEKAIYSLLDQGKRSSRANS